jgi:hypothetical protein
MHRDPDHWRHHVISDAHLAEKASWVPEKLTAAAPLLPEHVFSDALAGSAVRGSCGVNLLHPGTSCCPHLKR